MTFNPVIVFLQSTIFYSFASYLIDLDGFLFFIGLICFALGFLFTRYLVGRTILTNGYIIYLIGILGLFASIIIVNNVEFVLQNIFINHLRTAEHD